MKAYEKKMMTNERFELKVCQ